MSSLLVFMCVLPVLKISLFYATATSAIYTLSLHDALPISFAVNDPGGTVQSFHIHLLQRGGDLFDAEGTPTLKTPEAEETDRKSTRLNSSHVAISYAVFCLKKKNVENQVTVEMLTGWY